MRFQVEADFFFLLFLEALGIEPRASDMVGILSTIGLYFYPR